MNIFQIQSEYLRIAEALTEGEATPELESELAITESQMQQKGIAYGFVCKQIESDVVAIDAEIKRLTAMKQARNNTIDRLYHTISQAMQLFGLNELKSATLKLSFRKSTSVEIVNESQIDVKYFNVKEVKTVNKTLIKTDIESGISVEGAVLNINQNLQIK